MATLCPLCGYQDTQTLADRSMCLSCGLTFKPDEPAPKKKGKK